MRRKGLTAAAALLLATLTMSVSGQSVKNSKDNPPQSKPAVRRPADPSGQWWAAQRSLEAAIQQLEEYLRLNPSGGRAETAKQQLEVLRGLTAAASKPNWVHLYLGAAVSSEWRVSAVERLSDRTTVTLEIRCTQTIGECAFPAFDRGSPLVMLDSSGSYYPQVEAGEVPRDVRFVEEYGSSLYRFQPGRAITVTADFAPVKSSAAYIQVQYRDKNMAQPAKFPLTRQKM